MLHKAVPQRGTAFWTETAPGLVALVTSNVRLGIKTSMGVPYGFDYGDFHEAMLSAFHMF